MRSKKPSRKQQGREPHPCEAPQPQPWAVLSLVAACLEEERGRRKPVRKGSPVGRGTAGLPCELVGSLTQVLPVFQIGSAPLLLFKHVLLHVQPHTKRRQSLPGHLSLCCPLGVWPLMSPCPLLASCPIFPAGSSSAAWGHIWPQQCPLPLAQARLHTAHAPTHRHTCRGTGLPMR